MTLSVDAILERLARIDCSACICFRPSFYRSNKDHDCRWYLQMGRVVMVWSDLNDLGEFELRLNCASSNIVHGHSGPSPEGAVRNGWAQILRDMKNPQIWFLRYYGSHPNKSIMESERFMWIRWNECLDDWESPPAKMLQSVPENRIKTYHPDYPDQLY